MDVTAGHHGVFEAQGADEEGSVGLAGGVTHVPRRGAHGRDCNFYACEQLISFMRCVR